MLAEELLMFCIRGGKPPDFQIEELWGLENQQLHTSSRKKLLSGDSQVRLLGFLLPETVLLCLFGVNRCENAYNSTTLYLIPICVNW